MTVASSSAPAFADLQGLADLKREARDNSAEALNKVARQFEAVFLQMMLKASRDASLGDPLFDSNEGNLYRDMFDQQIASSLSQTGGLGIAEVLVRQLRDSLPQGEQPGLLKAPEKGLTMRAVPAAATAVDDGAADQVPGKTESNFTRSTPLSAPASPAVSSPHAESANTPAVPDVVAASRSRAPDPVPLNLSEPDAGRFDTPGDFVATVWPHAERAAARIGIAPETLVAQAALETGWGSHIMSRGDAGSSYNLFGIKADARWQGERVSVTTTEYRDGVVNRERASFRAYDSLGESFDDYVNFLQNNPRYREALDQTRDPAAFTLALQEAGYATDPAYAAKIQRIMASDTLSQARATREA